MSDRTKKIHWRSALLTVLRLRKTGGLVENEVLEALNITLSPPSSPAVASPELTNKIQSYVSSDRTIRMCKWQHESILKKKIPPAAEGWWNCVYMLQYYTAVTDRHDGHGGYCIVDHDHLISPSIKQRGRRYRFHIETNFTIQYGDSLPYRMCGISQSRHPGALRLSGLEVISLLLLAIKCQETAPNEPFYTVRVFAVDSFSVRRLSARVPSAYICALLETASQATGGEPVDEIIIEQTRYFDLSNDREIEGLLTALLEDDDKEVKPDDSDSNSDSDIVLDPDSDWLEVDFLGLGPSFSDEYEKSLEKQT